MRQKYKNSHCGDLNRAQKITLTPMNSSGDSRQRCTFTEDIVQSII